MLFAVLLIVLHYQKAAIRPRQTIGRVDLRRFCTSRSRRCLRILDADGLCRAFGFAVVGADGPALTLAGLGVALKRRCGQGTVDSAFWWIFLPFPFAYAVVYARWGNACPSLNTFW